MTSPRWWICPDDPEAGYIDAEGEDEICALPDGIHVAYDMDGEWIGTVVVARCQLCGGGIPEGAPNPLCSFHDALGRIEGERARFNDEYPEGLVKWPGGVA